MPQETIVCKLTSPELQKRKSTVIALLHKQVLEKAVLSNGYAFRFRGTDSTIDQLIDFIKAERQCCEFFAFTIKISDEKNFIWLEITGLPGTKDFIEKELGL